MPGTPTPSPRRHRALATSTPTPLWPHPSCSRRQSQLRLLHLIARPNPAASASLLPHLPSSPCLPTLCRGHRGQVGGLPRAGAWMHPLPMSSCSPQAAPRGLDKRAGVRLPCQQKTLLLQDTLDPQKGNHSFYRRLLRSHQGRIPDQHFHLGPSGRPFATNRAWIRGSGPRVKG